jgi:hypothetical protein
MKTTMKHGEDCRCPYCLRYSIHLLYPNGGMDSLSYISKYNLCSVLMKLRVATHGSVDAYIRAAIFDEVLLMTSHFY